MPYSDYQPLYKQFPKWPKQTEAVRFVKEHAQTGCGLLLEMGVGKSRIVVEYLQWLFARKDHAIICIAAPLSVLHVWITAWDEWGKYPVAFVNLHDAGSAGIRKAQQLSSEGWPVICIVNYDTAKLLGYKMITRTKRDGTEVTERKKIDTGLEDVMWDVLVLDESTHIKNRGTTTSRFFRLKMRAKASARIILSGSAYTKRPLDVWAQIKFLTGEDTFPRNFEEFASDYGIPHPVIRGAYAGYKNIDQLVERLDSCCIMMKKSDVMSLPPVTHTTRYGVLSPKSKALYQQITEEMYAEFESISNEMIEGEVERLHASIDSVNDNLSKGRTVQENFKSFVQSINKIEDEDLRIHCSVTAEHIFSRMQKWSQITSGYIIPDREPGEPAEPVFLGTEKVSILCELLEDRNGEPTVIVVQHDPEEAIITRAIIDKFGFMPPILNGSVSANKRGAMVADAAKWPFFLVKESVACKGIDMRWTDTIIFYSHRHHTIDYEQMLARNHRGGVTHEHINYVHLIVRGTIDTDIYRSLNKDLDTKSSIETAWRKLRKFREYDT